MKSKTPRGSVAARRGPRGARLSGSPAEARHIRARGQASAVAIGSFGGSAVGARRRGARAPHQRSVPLAGEPALVWPDGSTIPGTESAISQTRPGTPAGRGQWRLDVEPTVAGDDRLSCSKRVRQAARDSGIGLERGRPHDQRHVDRARGSSPTFRSHGSGGYRRLTRRRDVAPRWRGHQGGARSHRTAPRPPRTRGVH